MATGTLNVVEEAEPLAERLARRLARERASRLAAEAIAERGLRDLYEKQEQLRLLEEVADYANQSASLNDAIQFAIDAVCRFAGYRLGHAYLCETAAGSNRLVSTTIWSTSDSDNLRAFRALTEATRFRAGQGLPGRVLATGSPAWIGDIAADDNFPRADAAASAGFIAAFAFPVLVRDEVTAVLEFFADKICEPDETLLRLMSHIGTQLGRVVERKRAEDERVAAQARQHAHDRRRLVEESEEKLHAQFMRLHTAINNISQGLAMFDAGKTLVVCNSRYAEMYDLTQDEVKPGTTLRDIVERHIAKGHYCGSDSGKYLNKLLAPITAAARQLRKLRDGRSIVVSLQPMANGGWVATHDDITERQQVEARIAHMAHHDALTDLPNRVLFRERLDFALSRVRRGESLAVHCFDLDRFKAVNDTLGHAAGDKLLQIVADRLRGCVRDTDTAARLGGDEFAVIQVPASAEQAAAMARRLREAISEPCDLDGHLLVVDASIGVSMAPADSVEADQLLRNADIALYGAKTGGGSAYCFFEPEMDAAMKARRELELDLRKAIANDEFELHFQPIVNLSRGEVTCCEALLRWRHPIDGLIAPDRFIPLAEEAGLMVPLGAWVLKQACTDAAAWPNDVKVAINVSPSQIASPTLVESVAGALAQSGLAPRRLELEITESVLMQNNEATRATLHRLRDLGVAIAMDDFGTGYSSLSYLRSFPFDKIKIDRSFVAGLPDDGDSLAIVEAIAHLAKSLKMVTTAEGVETIGQHERIRELGCTEVQGYLFSRPIPKADIVRLLARQPGWAASAA